MASKVPFNLKLLAASTTLVTLVYLTHNVSGASLALVNSPANEVAPAKSGDKGKDNDQVKPEVRGKPVSESAIAVSYNVTTPMVDSHGRIYAGEVLKIMDVLAGVASKRHTGLQTVTISLDRVIFLRPVRVGDILHFVVSVNRTWSSSLECGVRCVREDYTSGEKEYACHAYFTFVAKVPIVSLPTAIPNQKSWWDPRGWVKGNEKQSPAKGETNGGTPVLKTEKFKGVVVPVIPQTVLEKKRYLLAQRRRTTRMRTQSPSYVSTLKKFRDHLLYLSSLHASAHVGKDEDFASSSSALIPALEKSYLIDAYLRGDPDVVVDEEKGVLRATVEGEEGREEEVSVSMEEVHMETQRRRSSSMSKKKGRHLRNLNLEAVLGVEGSRGGGSGWKTPVGPGGALERPLEVWETHAMELQVVRPEHCNSVNVLFGGVAMRWLEEVSTMAARRLYTGPFYTVSIDSLVFRNSVMPGEVVFLRAFVLKTWESSAEIYATAYAESRTAAHNRRFVNDAFFTLVALHPRTGEPMKGKLRRVRAPERGEEGAEELRIVMDGAEERRQDRVRERELLEMIYA
ncbi:Thioesterase/thiol ester dehydrase-isomerase [Atractiella rhizophila]|nr:Thioesterase/thiol ester dehydrase-isomerase [Atractiella rhizophila]